MTDLDAIAQSVRRSGMVNIILWGSTGVLLAFCVLWALLGGPEANAKARTEAVGQLWTVMGPWVFGLAAKSKFTGEQKTAVAEAVNRPVVQ